MRPFLFIIAAIIISSGTCALKILPEESGLNYFVGSLTLGGAFLICALFSLKMPLHGLIGGAIIALLGFGRGILNLPNILTGLATTDTHAFASWLEAISLTCCSTCLLLSYRLWRKSQTNKLTT